MRKSFVHLTLFVIVASASASLAAEVRVADRATQDVSLATGGVVVIENTLAAGNIEVIGADVAKISITADRLIRGVDAAAVNEARQVVHRVIEGTERARIIRTAAPGGTNPRWAVQVNYSVIVPRTASVKINSRVTERIRIADVRGQVLVKNLAGPVVIENVAGTVGVENMNGDVTFIVPQQVTANAHLSSVNGSIIVRTPPNAGFVWEAETVLGSAKTGFEVRGGQFLTPTRFRGAINSAGNVTIVTETFKGHLLLAPMGGDDTTARPVYTMLRSRVVPPRGGGVGPMMPPNQRDDVRLPLVQGFFGYETTIGNVRIDEIRGATRIFTGAGEVHLGTVFGHCQVVSQGGPVTLGEIIGPLVARTDAGNVTVQRAREGGSITTGGGTILLNYTGGPTQLSSGGGDITVRQAAGPINAETKSGDISIAVDGKSKAERVTAKTAKGNIVITLPAGFGADVEATILTSDPTLNIIRSDLAGLSVQREQVGGKTRVRATGKFNGGGEKLELNATDGGIHINVDAPRVSPQVPRQ